MGFHNVLTGEDLHEPSRVRMVNDVTVNQAQVTLLPGQLVKIDGGVIEGVLTVTELAEVGDTLVGFVDTIIASGNEATIVLFGRLLDVEVEDPTGINQDLKEGDFLRVNGSSRFEKIDSEEGRVATVLRRTADSTTMNVLFNPTSSTAAPVPQIMVLNTPAGLPTTVLQTEALIEIPQNTATGRTTEEIDLSFLNNNDFVILDSNDSMQLSGNSISIERDGVYEITIPDHLVFSTDTAGTSGFWTSGDGNVPNVEPGTTTPATTTITFNLMVRLTRSGTQNFDIFRVQLPSTSFETTAGNKIFNLGGNLEPSTSVSRGSTDTTYLSTVMQSKLIPMNTGDIVSLLAEFVLERSVAVTNDNAQVPTVYSESSPNDFFNFFMSVKRIT